MDFDQVTMELLRPAADSLRRALRRMDDTDVPASLRPVADSSARRLPPPLLRRALGELDASEWLRAETAAEEDLDPGSAAALFVERPEGWRESISAFAGNAAEQRERRQQSVLESDLSRARQQIEELRGRLERAQADAVAAYDRGRSAATAEREAALKARSKAEAIAREEAQRAAQLETRLERLTAELDSTSSRVDALRGLLEKERRSPTVVEPSGRGWFPDDPAEMAAELDRIQAAIRRPPRTAVRDEPEVEREFRLPAEVRPDRSEAVHWLLGGSWRWMIDGYNVAFQIADEPDATVRDRVVATAARLASLAEPGSMIVVVFDSSVDAGSLVTDRRVRVVFAPSADEWILEHATGGTVVVSSDRRVREGAEANGALGIWSEAVTEWIHQGGNRR